MGYKRVEGGEKNELSGKRWTEDELYKVYILYNDLNGEGIHERNLKIISLGTELGRTTRSVEAQLIMFRNMSKSGEYGYGNMNKLVKKIWQVNENDKMSHQKIEFTMKVNGLEHWKSETKGGVRKPFDEQTGRPLGSRIKTPLSKRIDQLLNGTNLPKAIFLIGGPGNGKTDTMEYIVGRLDDVFGIKGQLTNIATEAFKDYDWLERIPTQKLNIPYKSIDLIQDASDDDPKTEGNPTKPLIHLLNLICEEEYDGFCVCCINRGILDSLKREIAKNNGDSLVSKKAKQLFDSLIESIGPNGPFVGKSCWPFLDQYYAWPMDVDSVLDYYNNDEIIGEEILKRALKFIQKPTLFEDDSLSLNFSAIEDDKSRKNLIKILRKCEIKGSYRFTFRELFALTSHLLEAGPSSKKKKGNGTASDSSPLKEFKSTHAAWSELYYNKLFNNDGLYNVRSQIIQNASKIKGKKKWEEDNFDVREVLKIIFCKQNFSGSYIKKVIGQDDFQSLDPARSSSRQLIGGTDLSFSDIETAFSIGIDYGMNRCSNYLNDLELNYLRLLFRAETESIDIESIKGNYQVSAEKLKGLLRRYCSIVAKRAIGTRAGVVNEDDIIENYLGALNKDTKLREFIAHSLGPAIYEDGKFKVSLGTPIGQSKESVVDDVVLYFNKGEIPKPISLDHIDQPDWSLIGIKTGSGGDLVINYDLFQAIYRKGKLLEDPGCLSSEVMIGLENIVSKISANRVHSHYNLASDQVDMHLGLETSLAIKIDGTFKANNRK